MDDGLVQQIAKFKQIKTGERIPYYASYFKRQEDLLFSYCELIEKDQKLDVFKTAELQTILQGICYYYDVIMSGEQSDADKKKCNKLVESTNRALCLTQNEIDERDELYDTCLLAYREYLQEICNVFRAEKNGAPSLIFSFALDRMSGRVYMDGLFTQIYEAPNPLPTAFLSTVFVPMDHSIGDVFKYLPMLTHEVSHNFKYSETENRNKFIVRYMCDRMASHIVRRLLMQKADGKCGVFIGGAEDFMSKALSSALVQEISKMEPTYMAEGHLEYLPSLLYSILTGPLRLHEKLGDYYQIGDSKFDILRKAILGLANQSNWNWYLTCEEEMSNRTESELLASLLVDLVGMKDTERLQWYRDCAVEDSCRETMERAIKWYENGKISLDDKLVFLAIEEMLLSAMESIKDDFQEYVTKYQEAKEVLLSLKDSQKYFKLRLDQLVDVTSLEDKQVLYAFADRCIDVKNNINSIQLLRRIFDKAIEKEDVSDNVIVRIYGALQETVKKELSDPKRKLYLTARDNHAILIKLGLLGGDQSEQFVEIFKEILYGWGKEEIYETLNDYLAVYREIFADLSMCAVFGLTQMGYLRYMTERFGDVGEMGGHFLRNMTLERVQMVLRVLDCEYPKQEFAEQYRNQGLGNECAENQKGISKDWVNIISTYLDADRSDEYDERYIDVYNNKIVTSKWVKRLRKNEIIGEIGAYYNELNLKEEKRREISQCFLKQYVEKANRREKLYKMGNLDPISVILEDIADGDI